MEPTDTLICVECGEKVESNSPREKCPKCGGRGTLEYQVDYNRLKEGTFTGEFSFWRYRALLPKVRN
ncbi:MAG: hypothetical protein QXG68_05120, partial [Candidatus Bathyarchaeia archaeon]